MIYKLKECFIMIRYTTPDGKESFAAVTQFESTSARRCFPCWDEPALKATFDATLVVPKKLVGLSNMVNSLDFFKEKFP